MDKYTKLENLVIDVQKTRSKSIKIGSIKYKLEKSKSNEVKIIIQTCLKGEDIISLDKDTFVEFLTKEEGKLDNKMGRLMDKAENL